jgi:YtkA-like protein
VHLFAASRAAAGYRCVIAIRLLCVFCVCLLALEGCRRATESTSELTLAHEVSPQPPRVGQLTITLKPMDASGKPVEGAQITLEGNMSHAGMVPVFAEAREVAPGGYRANIDLSMAGDWFVLVHITLRDGRKLERQFEIKGVTPPL